MTSFTGDSVFYFKYSSTAGIVEINCCQTVLQVIFKCQKEIGTLSAVALKKTKSFIAHQCLEVSFILHILTHFFLSVFFSSYIIKNQKVFTNRSCSLRTLPRTLGNDRNYKKWESFMQLCAPLFLCSSPYPPVPTYHLPFFPQAPSLHLSTQTACVWILMLITPCMKIAVRSLISPRSLLQTHTNVHKVGYHKDECLSSSITGA